MLTQMQKNGLELTCRVKTHTDAQRGRRRRRGFNVERLLSMTPLPSASSALPIMGSRIMSSASRVKPAARSGAKAPTTPAVASVPFTATAAAAASV
jgi:hypothetical protein